MKVSELAIGDWVCAAGLVINGEERQTPPMRVVAIGETWVHLLIDPEAGDPDEYDIDDIRPINLTTKILLNNEWEVIRSKCLRWEPDPQTGAEAEVDLERIINIDIWKPFISISIPSPFVHELQHAFRLAGIEEEIKL